MVLPDSVHLLNANYYCGVGESHHKCRERFPSSIRAALKPHPQTSNNCVPVWIWAWTAVWALALQRESTEVSEVYEQQSPLPFVQQSFLLPCNILPFRPSLWSDSEGKLNRNNCVYRTIQLKFKCETIKVGKIICNLYRFYGRTQNLIAVVFVCRLYYYASASLLLCGSEGTWLGSQSEPRALAASHVCFLRNQQ